MAKGGEIEMKRMKLVAGVLAALMLVAGPGLAAGGSAAPYAPAHTCPPAC